MHATIIAKLSVFAAALAAAALFSTAPASAQSGQVCFYEHDDFRGRSWCIHPGDQESNLKGADNNSFSSVDVPPGVSVEACEDEEFRGSCRRIDRTINSLRRIGMNDNISSVRTDNDRGRRGRDRDFDRRDRRDRDWDRRDRRDRGFDRRDRRDRDWDRRDRRDRGFDRRGDRRGGRGEVCFYEHSGFRGDEVCTRVGEAVDYVGDRNNDRFSSVNVPRGAHVVVCEHANFRGRCGDIDGDIDNFSRLGINDRISSFRSTWR